MNTEFHGPAAERSARKKTAVKALSILLAFAMVLQSSPFAYADDAFAALEQEEVTAAALEEGASEEATSEEAGPATEEPAADEAPAEADAEPEAADQAAAEDNAEAEEAPTKTEYIYEDDALKVTATLDDAAAIPDDAQLKVTPITAESDGYNYDAYLTALNNATESEISPKNVLLHDIAFLVTDETGKIVEVEPSSGAVHLSFEFKQDQLASIGAKDNEDVCVAHLPLAEEALAEVATTAEATDISAADVAVEAVMTPEASVEAENLSYTLTSLSVTATYTDDHGVIYNPSTDITSTVSYSTVLGRAVEYGVVAQEVNIAADFQSNFATNDYTNTGNHWIGTDLGGTNDVPYIATNINTTPLQFKQGGYTVQMVYDLYTSEEYESVDPLFVISSPQYLTVNAIFQDASSLETNVNKLIEHVAEQSEALAAKPETMDVTNSTYDQNDFIIDTTPYDDNAVIYISVPAGSTLEAVFGQKNDGVHIKKTSGQVVVFNFENKGSLNFVQFRVTDIDPTSGAETTISSVGSGSDEGNRQLDEIILRKVILNAPKATSITIQAAIAGLLVAPKAEVTVNSTSTGWVVANKFSNPGGEWHFGFHDRHYSSGGSLSFSARKEITDATTGEVVVPEGLDYSTFKFRLYETGPDYEIDENAKMIEEVSASNDSTKRYEVAFSDLSYTDSDLDKRLKDTHYYVIKEVIPDGTKDEDGVRTKDGIGYWTGELDIQVDVSDREQDGSMTFVVSSWKYKTAEDVANDTPYRVNDKVEAVGSVFTFGALPNTYTAEGKATPEATKQLEGATLTDGQFTFELTGTQDFAEGAIEKYIDSNGVEHTTAERNEDGTYTVDAGSEVEAYTYDGNTYSAERVTKNDDGTYTVTVVKRALADEVTVSNLAEYAFSTKVPKTTVTKNADGSYTYNGQQYDADAVTDNEDDNYGITATRSDTEIVKNNDFTYEFTFELPISEVVKSDYPTTITYNGSTYAYSWVNNKMTLDDGTIVEQTYWPEEGFRFTVSGLEESDLTKNADGTYSYEWGGMSQTGTATESGDGTYTFADKTYPASAVTENSGGTRTIVIAKSAAHSNVTENSDGTYTYEGVIYYANEVTNKGDGTYQIELLDQDADGLSVTDEYGNSPDNTYTVSIVEEDGSTETVVATGLSEVDVDATKQDEGLDVTAVVQADDVVDNGDGTYTYEDKIFSGMQNADGTYTLTLAEGVNEVSISADSIGSYTVDVTVPAEQVSPPSHGEGTTVTIKKVVYNGQKYELSDLAYEDGVYTMPYKDTATNKANGTVTFRDILYTASDVGTHTYTMHEVIPTGATDNGDGTWTKNGITYDGHEAKVTVTVEDNGDGTLKVTKEYNPEGGNVFKNKKTTLSGSAVLQVTKQLTGRAWTGSDSFKFDLAFAEGSATTGATLPTTTELEVTGTVGSTTNATAAFDAITFTQAGEWTFTITEQEPTGATNGIEYGADDTGAHTIAIKATEGDGALKIQYKLDGASEWADVADTITAGTFKNAYSATGSVTFVGTKTMEGRELTADDVFSFVVTENGKNVATATSDATGKIAYPTIEYTLADVGEHTYVVQESSTNGKGVTVDTRTYTVTVKVEDVNHNGKLTVTASDNATALDFVNTYEAKGSVTFEGTKTLEGRALTADDVFTFTVAEGDVVLAKVTNDAAGKIAYPTIPYVKDATTDDTGTHTYTVRETSEDGNGVVVDTRTYTVTVEVADNGDGTLKVTPSDNAKALDFANAYDAKASFTIKGLSKVLRNGTLKAEQFSFQLKDADGKVLQTVTNDAKGNISFSALSYTLADLGGAGSKTFRYTVSEVIPAGATKNADGTWTKDKITYSGDVVSFEVAVSDNGDGTLAFSGVKDGVLDLGHQFVNTTKPDVPHTNDLTNYGLIYALAAAGLVVLGSGVSTRRRRRRA